MQQQQYDQNATRLPLAHSVKRLDLIHAAEARAEFWQYGDTYVVSVELPNHKGDRSGTSVEVRCRGGEFYVLGSSDR
jgi:hypothetical protein